MDEMQAFRIEFTMQGPIALRSDDLRPCCSLLAWVRQRELGGDYERAHREMPVASEDGVFQISALMLEVDERDDVLSEPIIVRQSISRTLTLQPKGVPKDKNLPRAFQIKASSGLFRNIETPYSLLNVVRVHAFGVGVIADIARLARKIFYIGPRGYGIVLNTVEEGPAIEVEPVDADLSTFGFLDATGAPARALPLPLAEKLGVDIDKYPIIGSRIRPPYWAGERVPCVVPPTALVTRDKIALMEYGA